MQKASNRQPQRTGDDCPSDRQPGGHQIMSNLVPTPDHFRSPISCLHLAYFILLPLGMFFAYPPKFLLLFPKSISFYWYCPKKQSPPHHKEYILILPNEDLKLPSTTKL